MIRSRFISHLRHSPRCIHTSTRLDSFKLKFTDEMVANEEEKRIQKELDKEKLKPKPALHTLESSLIMGRVSDDRYKSVIKVGVPKHRFNDHIILYRKENDDVQAIDEKNECKPGDWVLLRRQKEPVDANILFTVERVVYQYGNYIDPLTNRRSFGLFYDDDIKRLEKIKVKV